MRSFAMAVLMVVGGLAWGQEAGTGPLKPAEPPYHEQLQGVIQSAAKAMGQDDAGEPGFLDAVIADLDAIAPDADDSRYRQHQQVLGELLLKNGSFARCQAVLETITDGSYDTTTWRNLFKAMLAQGKEAEARVRFDRLLQDAEQDGRRVDRELLEAVFQGRSVIDVAEDRNRK